MFDESKLKLMQEIKERMPAVCQVTWSATSGWGITISGLTEQEVRLIEANLIAQDPATRQRSGN
jgi:hypothetical protein